MPRIPGFPEKPRYNSVKVYLSELAKDIAEMVVDNVKMERFREQLKIYANLLKQWTTFYEADHQGCWVPSMGRPECIFNIFSRSYNPLKDIEKEAKRLAGSYALCALIHDSQLPHLDKINTDIIPIESIEETLSSPRNTLEGRIVGNWNSGPDVREIYLIEEFFNRVTVDLQELCKSEENKLTQASIGRQIKQASQLSDEEFLELTAKKFEERAKKVLSKDETWHDLDRSLKVWFDSVIGRLKKRGFPENDIGFLKYLYKNLLFYARGINIKRFRGFPDPSIFSSARKQASELAEKFKGFSQRVKDNLASEKSEEKEEQKVKPEDKIHSSGNDGDNSVEWDVFICHASEDKENFVDPLANVLKEEGIKVWYDRFELKLGDSLRGKIDEGLANSRYGVIVLSSNFFKKEWPKTELDALVSRQNEKGEKVILPIWHGIGIEEVRKFSPILASKLAAQSSESLESIVFQIKNVLNENSTPKKPVKDKRESTETEQDDKGQEHFSNPISIAQKVASLLTQIPSSKMMFQEQIRDFCEKSNEYNEALKKHLKDVEANHQWKKYGDGKPPYEGWIWDSFQDVWRPTIGFCPSAWVEHYFGWNPFGIFDKPTEPTTQKERLMCEYAVLAAIHDTYLKDLPVCDRLFETNNEEIIPNPFPLTKWGEFYEGVRIRTNIQRALEHVESDLHQKEEKSLAEMRALRTLFERIPTIGPALYHLFPMIFNRIKLKIRRKRSPVSFSLNSNERLSERYAIAKNKPCYKKAWAMVVSSVIILAALTTLLLNFDKIIDIFRGEAGKQTYSYKPFNGSKLDISLITICQDIDSRPLTQKKETAEKYVGIKIKEERLKLLEINKNPEGDIYLLSMVFPDQSNTSYSTGRRIICDIPIEQHPELNLAKQGVELYISGQIKEAGVRYIKLSDVSLKFD